MLPPKKFDTFVPVGGARTPPLIGVPSKRKFWRRCECEGGAGGGPTKGPTGSSIGPGGRRFAAPQAWNASLSPRPLGPGPVEI